MSNLFKTRAAKFIGVFVAVVMVVGVAAPATANAALDEGQIQAILDFVEAFVDDQAVINDVEAALRGEPTSGDGTTGGSTSSVCPYVWDQNLQIGDTGADVMKLQQFLNDELSTPLAQSGAGSPGSETQYYGSITAAGVKRFQEKYRSDILDQAGLSSGTNFFWTLTRAKANDVCASAPSDTDDGDDQVSTPTGTARIVSVSQPSGTLAPDNASRVPFTKFAIQAGASDVTLHEITVERVGLGSNSAFSGIQLQDGDGVLLGNEKTLNSNNKARLGEDHVVEAGTTETFTVIGNMPADNSSRAGEQLTLRVVDVDTDASLGGASLPITGASHTVNATLSIGSADATVGSLDPTANTTKEVGTTGYTFQSIKITAGSAEDVRVRSIRWDQTGSASQGDLANVKVVVDGTKYDTTVNGGGDKYTAVFPGDGLLLKKGFNEEFSIEGDIVGGSDRTVIFDIENATDIHVVGETFGYGITPTQSDDGTASDTGTQLTSGTPFFDGAKVDVSTGSLTISSSNAVAAQNVANGASDVNLGAFKFDVRGEGINWSSIKFTIATTATANNGQLTNITLVDENGSVIAGPEDPTFSSANTYTVTLSDSVSLGSDVHTLYVRGNLDSNWSDDDTIQVKLTPNSTNIASLEGNTTGRTITPTPSSQVSAKTQTVAAGALSVAPSVSLASQNIISNSSDVLLGQFVLDATASGEDLRVTVVKMEATAGANMDVDDVNTLQLVDENGNALNTGGNNVNPSGNSADDDPTLTFTLDDALVVPKSTSVVLNLRGNIATGSSATTNSTLQFDFSANISDGDWTVTGADTGKEITETFVTGTSGATLTITSGGTLTATLSPSDPNEKWYIAGKEATVGVFEFDSNDEAFDITDLGILLDTASSSAADFQQIRLYDGSTLITGKKPTFTSNKEAFSLSTGDFRVDADTEKDLTVKALLANVGTNQVGTSGNKIRISTSTKATDNKARGLESGSSSNISGSASTSTGARYFKSLPTVTKLTPSNTTISATTEELYRFSVKADANGRVLIEQFTFNVATPSGGNAATATSFKLSRVSDGAIVDQSIEADKNTRVKMQVDSTEGFSAGYITIPANETQSFKLEATTEDATGNDSGKIETKLIRDTAYPSIASKVMDTTANLDSHFFVWSPRSTTSSLTASDWTNSYKVPGLETSDLGVHVLTD